MLGGSQEVQKWLIVPFEREYQCLNEQLIKLHRGLRYELLIFMLKHFCEGKSKYITRIWQNKSQVWWQFEFPF